MPVCVHLNLKQSTMVLVPTEAGGGMRQSSSIAGRLRNQVHSRANFVLFLPGLWTLAFDFAVWFCPYYAMHPVFEACALRHT
eukprot:1326860-Rhodomonas_salina.3